MDKEESQQLPLAVRLLGALLFTFVPPIMVALIFGNPDATSWVCLIVWVVAGMWGVHIYRTGFDDSGAAMVILGPIWLVSMIIMSQVRPARS